MSSRSVNGCLSLPLIQFNRPYRRTRRSLRQRCYRNLYRDWQMVETRRIVTESLVRDTLFGIEGNQMIIRKDQRKHQRKHRQLMLWAVGLYVIAIFTFMLRADAVLYQESATELSRRAFAILRQNCFGCHGAGKMSGLDLRTAESVLAGGDNGKVIEPFDASASRLYQFITHQAKPTMPPGKKLPDAAVETLRRWIEAGASFDGFDKEAAVEKNDEPAKERKSVV